jgi:hypothetical protein
MSNFSPWFLSVLPNQLAAAAAKARVTRIGFAIRRWAQLPGYHMKANSGTNSWHSLPSPYALQPDRVYVPNQFVFLNHPLPWW